MALSCVSCGNVCEHWQGNFTRLGKNIHIWEAFYVQHALDQIDGRIGEIVVFGFFPVNSFPWTTLSCDVRRYGPGLAVQVNGQPQTEEL
jgi:hypothetical protein